MFRRSVVTTFAALVGLGGLEGCGSANLGPDTTQVEGFVLDDPAAGEVAFSGTAAGDFQFSISSDGQTWIDVGSPNGITVPLQTIGGEISVHGAQPLAEGTYRRVRITLSDVEITVAAGSTVGGVIFSQEMKTVLAGETPLSIELSVSDLVVAEGQRLEVRFDLNVEAWLTAAAVQTGVVTSTGIESAVTVVAAVR